MYENLAILASFIFLYSITGGGLERTPINGAVVFTVFGVVFGPLGLDILTLNVDSGGLGLMAELALALVLFTDAAHTNFNVLKKSLTIPYRLLLIALPLVILLGFGVGVLVFNELTLLEIAILATMLAPTDAALGKSVVKEPSVPADIREGLNMESGLNDGICVPILFVFLTLALDSGTGGSTSMLALKLVAKEIGIGAAAGLIITFSGAWLIKQFSDKGWITESWEQLTVAALSVACFTAAQSIHGSGFISAFVGGLLFGWLAKRHNRRHELLLSAESTADTLTLITWVVFGAVVINNAIGKFSWEAVLYAILSLTLIRMVPVLLALAGTTLSAHEKLFVGWFGPRGLASIVFGVIVLNRQLPGGETLAITVVCTIGLSVIAHGLSANPLVALLKKRGRSI
jgi:NhaP-type Na+/H+ or K+/H+ antiporter